jgi:hypothetical protein
MLTKLAGKTRGKRKAAPPLHNQTRKDGPPEIFSALKPGLPTLGRATRGIRISRKGAGLKAGNTKKKSKIGIKERNPKTRVPKTGTRGTQNKEKTKTKTRTPG